MKITLLVLALVIIVMLTVLGVLGSRGIQARASAEIAAPQELIFQAVADLPNLPNIDPDVTGIELLTAGPIGVGTRFRETRTMRGEPMITELEITEYQAPAHARMVADSHGTIWDTVFTVEPAGDRYRLSLVMDARAHALMPRFLNPLLKPMFQHGMEQHVTKVKQYCEAQAAAIAGNEEAETPTKIKY